MKLFLFFFCATCIFVSHALAKDVSLGPFYDLFPLTLSSGHRVEVAGPLFYFEEQDSQKLWAVPPLFSYTTDHGVDFSEFDILYPLLSYDRFGSEYRFHILQVFAFAGGQNQDETANGRFTLFPFYFQQRSEHPELNYTALLPFYGTIRNRLFRDEIKFVMMPLYVHTRKKDVVTDNFVYPIFHLRHGNALHGWQLWPLLGFEHKDITNKTNSLDEIEIVGGHDKFFALWPFFLKTKSGIGTTNPEAQISIVPLFTSMRSPQRDSTTYFWPLGLTLTHDREKKYREIGAPWPLIVFARGEGKHTSRVWPIYSRAENARQQSRFYLWPLYKYNRFHSDPLDRERTRIMLFLYSDISEKNTETGVALRRKDFWPLFTFRRDFDGNERLQVLSLLEPLLPNSKSIDRNYSQIWSIWRSEKNAKTGATSKSLLWNLYRRDSAPDSKKCSFLFGLFQYQSSVKSKSWRVFYIPVGKNEKPSSNNASKTSGPKLKNGKIGCKPELGK